MPKLTEFYPELQGRPDSKIILDLEKRQPSIPSGSISPGMLLGGEDYVKTEDLDRIVNELTTKLEEVLVELKQVKLHLASGSDENIDERTVRE